MCSINTDSLRFHQGKSAEEIQRSLGAEGMEGFVAIGGCDKNMPGSMIAIARLNRPTFFVYGGTILPGCLTMNSPAAMN